MDRCHWCDSPVGDGDDADGYCANPACGAVVAVPVVDGRGVQITVETDRIEVRPGEMAEVWFRVRNAGRLADHYALVLNGVEDVEDAVRGRPDRGGVAPSEVGLAPGAVTRCRLWCSFPETAQTRPGPRTLVVSAVSHTEPQVCARGRVRVQVRCVLDFTLQIEAPVRRFRRRTVLPLTVANTGNAPASIRLAADEETGHLTSACLPETLEVAVEQAATGYLLLAAWPRRLWGRNRRWRVTVTAEAGDVTRRRSVLVEQRAWVPGPLLRLFGREPVEMDHAAPAGLG